MHLDDPRPEEQEDYKGEGKDVYSRLFPPNLFSKATAPFYDSWNNIPH